jgi:hypothetical protein
MCVDIGHENSVEIGRCAQLVPATGANLDLRAVADDRTRRLD